MTIFDAESLLKKGVLTDHPQTWADLGCGVGLFTRALSRLLPDGSTIYALDKNSQPEIKSENPKIEIRFKQSDIATEPLELPQLNGILMANVFHFIEDKLSFLEKLSPLFSEKENYIIAEYDRNQPNPWIPYPIELKALRSLFEKFGDFEITKLGEVKSSFGNQNIYAARISRN